MHEHLDCLGLINMNARIYEPATCSFLSPDPLIADEENWLNYNRYLYCLGNPVKFADPTGMQIVTPSDMPLTGPTGVVPQNGGGAFGVVNTYWEYDPSNSCNPVWLVVEGSYNGANNSNDYFVNYATSGNSAYAASITADHRNAIDWQISYAGAKAMEGVNVDNSIFQGTFFYASAFSESFVYGAERLVKEKGYLINELTKNVILKDGGEMPKTDFVYGKGIGNFTRGMEVLGKGALIIQIGVSIFNMADAYSTNNKYKHKILGKSLIDIAVPALCIAIGGPGAWIVGGAYFVVDVAGGWNYVWGIEQ